MMTLRLRAAVRDRTTQGQREIGWNMTLCRDSGRVSTTWVQILDLLRTEWVTETVWAVILRPPLQLPAVLPCHNAPGI
jgi:hypothetical protein